MNDVEVDLLGVGGKAESAAKGIAFGAELMQFAEALVLGDDAALRAARAALLERAGAEALVDAAGVAANFQRMVRIADATGIPVDSLDSDLSREIRETLNLDSFETAEHALGSDRRT